MTLTLPSERPITATTTRLIVARTSFNVKPASRRDLFGFIIANSAVLGAAVRRANPDSARWADNDLFAYAGTIAQSHPISARGSPRRKRDRAVFSNTCSFRYRLSHQCFGITLNRIIVRALQIRQLETNIFRGGAHLDAVELGLNLADRIIQRISR